MLGAAVGANAASFIDPALRFRTLRTAHFAIHFHQGEEGLAARLGAIAESVWLRMSHAMDWGSLPVGTAEMTKSSR